MCKQYASASAVLKTVRETMTEVDSSAEDMFGSWSGASAAAAKERYEILKRALERCERSVGELADREAI